jgi:hypothetical protein
MSDHTETEIPHGPEDAPTNAVSNRNGALANPEASAPMLDVHAPHEVSHTWKGFFIHIATIVTGLFIAVALEQSVEALHNHHEVAALREDLHAESRQTLLDARRAEAAQIYELDWLGRRVVQVRAAIFEHHPLEPREPYNVPVFASPDIPIWRSAKAGSRISLLTKGEMNAYGEIEYVQRKVETLSDARKGAEDAVRGFHREFPVLSNGDIDFTQASPQDLRRYLTLLATTGVTIDRYLFWLRMLQGAELAVIEGKTNPDDLYASETKIAGTAAGDPL